MNIGILTSGGDAPGMNALISNIVSLAEASNHKVFAFQRGYQGLVENDLVRLTSDLTDNIFHLGGSYIKSFRSSDFLTEKGFNSALTNIKNNNIDVLIVSGGDGTLKGAKKLAASGVNIIYVPSTIDNDLQYTERSLGFDSALNSAVDYIEKIKMTMLSMNRIFICEVMGRYSPELAKNCAYATNATYLIESKKDCDEEKIINTFREYLNSGKNTPFIIVRENSIDINKLAKLIQNEFDIETRATVVGYVQRGASPSVCDRILARQFAELVIENINNNIYNLALGVKHNLIKGFDFKEISNK